MSKKWEITNDGFIVLTDPTGRKCNYSKVIFKHVAQSNGGNYFKNSYNLSQEEIDALIQEATIHTQKDNQIEFDLVGNGFNWQEDKPKAEIKCPPHNFVEYLGLNERFMHCKDCGVKKL